MATPTNPFLSFVGLKSLTPDAQVWVNDIPGISAELVTHLTLDSDRIGAPDDAEDIRLMWEKVNRNALKKLEGEIRIELSKKGDYQPVLATMEPAAPTGLPAPLPLTDDYAYTGLMLTVPYVPGTSLELDTVSVIVQALATAGPTVPHLLYVYDLTHGVKLHEAEHDLALGVNQLPLNLTLSNRFLQPTTLAVLLINFDRTLLKLPAPAWATAIDGVSCVSVRAVDTWAVGDALTPADGALTLSAQWSRSIADNLSPYVADLTYAYALLCASLLLTEKMGNPRLSLWTLSNRAFADRMEDRYLVEARGLIRIVARRMAEKWAIPTATANTGALTERNDWPQIEVGSYV